MTSAFKPLTFSYHFPSCHPTPFSPVSKCYFILSFIIRVILLTKHFMFFIYIGVYLHNNISFYFTISIHFLSFLLAYRIFVDDWFLLYQRKISPLLTLQEPIKGELYFLYVRHGKLKSAFSTCIIHESWYHNINQLRLYKLCKHGNRNYWKIDDALFYLLFKRFCLFDDYSKRNLILLWKNLFWHCWHCVIL